MTALFMTLRRTSWPSLALLSKSYQQRVWYGCPRKKCHEDKGNWTYAVLYFWMLHRMSEPQHQDNAMLLLSTTYSSLAANAPYTDTTLSMAGDVIECLLADVRMTGPMVPRHLLKARLAACKCISEFCDACGQLVQVLCDSEPVSCAHFVDPRAVIQAALSSIWT